MTAYSDSTVSAQRAVAEGFERAESDHDHDARVYFRRSMDRYADAAEANRCAWEARRLLAIATGEPVGPVVAEDIARVAAAQARAVASLHINAPHLSAPTWAFRPPMDYEIREGRTPEVRGVLDGDDRDEALALWADWAKADLPENATGWFGIAFDHQGVPVRLGYYLGLGGA